MTPREEDDMSGFFDEGAAPLDLIDDLPSRPSRPLQQALALVDAGKREREELRAEVEGLREALEKIAARVDEYHEVGWIARDALECGF